MMMVCPWIPDDLVLVHPRPASTAECFGGGWWWVVPLPDQNRYTANPLPARPPRVPVPVTVTVTVPVASNK